MQKMKLYNCTLDKKFKCNKNVKPVQILEIVNINNWESCKKNLHISFIYYTIYVVLFTWVFPYESPEIRQLFHQVSFLMI